MPFIALVYVDDHTAGAIDAGDAPWERSARTIGLFRWPERKNIGCTGCVENNKTQWVRDRVGFMRCGLCGKRNRLIRTFLVNALFDHLGANHFQNAPAAFRTPEGYFGTFADND